MRARLTGTERKSNASIAISIAAHVALFAGLAAITFHYPLSFSPRPTPMVETTIHYVRVASAPRPSGGGPGARSATRRSPSPMTVLAPRSIPVGVPKPTSPTSPRPAVGVAIGANNQAGRAASSASGVEPGIPDSRIAMNPMAPGHLLKTDAQKADSALSAIYDMYLDSARAAGVNPARAPGDWSWGGKGGDKWGWDTNGIHIGGITIPNAVLAALPLNIGPTGSNMNALTERRTDAFMRSDIQLHANAMSEDEFRTAVRRIRDRVDRERQEKLAKRRKDPP